MTKRTSGVDFFSPEQQQDGCDISLIQRPLQTAFEGFEEAKRTYENGSNEVRRLLLHECNLIYECKTCRSLFRSLVDFISHKRSICCAFTTLGSSNNDPTAPHAVTSMAKRMKSNAPSSTNLAVADLDDVNEDNLELSRIFEDIKSNEKHADETLKRCSKSLLVECLEKIDYQNIKNEDEPQNKVKKDMNSLDFSSELHQNGKTTDMQNEQNLENGQNVDAGNDEVNATQEYLSCKTCQKTFKTKELLELHKKSSHCTSPIVFQCPTCAMTFTQPNAVFRHLASEHKQPQHRRKRRNRDTILKNCASQDDVQESKEQLSPEVEHEECLLVTDSDTSSPKKIVTVEPKKKQKRMSDCYLCKKPFVRGVALTTHLLNCRLKQEMKEIETKREKLKPDSPVECVVQHIKKEKSIKEENDDTDTLNEMFANLGKQSFSPGLQTVSLDKLEMLQSDSSSASLPTQIEKIEPKSVVSSTPIKCRCKICDKSFNALSNLRRHISMFHYRARRFGCTLCDYRAFRRYDIVNHLGFVHKMEGDREEMSAKYVNVHEVKYSKEDVDSDIVVITDESEITLLAESSHLRTYQKCAKRKKLSTSKTPTGVTESHTRQHLKRARSHPLEPASGAKDATKVSKKRPIRNRIKPVNKDFVYDLTDLMKKDGVSPTDTNPDSPAEVGKSFSDLQRGPPPPLLCPTQKDRIKGAVNRLAKLAVAEGRAALATMPVLPVERPQMRPRIAPMHRGEMPPVSVIDSSDIEAACIKSSSFLSDSLLETIAKRNCGSFKLKPCLETQAPFSALNTLLQKVDFSLHNNNASKTKTDTETEIDESDEKQQNNTQSPLTDGLCQNLADDAALNPEADLATADNFYVEPTPSIPTSSSPPPTPKKRTLLQQRFAELHTKQRDNSLLRSALED